jgi:hypothetical protein
MVNAGLVTTGDSAALFEFDFVDIGASYGERQIEGIQTCGLLVIMSSSF